MLLVGSSLLITAVRPRVGRTGFRRSLTSYAEPLENKRAVNFIARTSVVPRLVALETVNQDALFNMMKPHLSAFAYFLAVRTPTTLRDTFLTCAACDADRDRRRGRRGNRHRAGRCGLHCEEVDALRRSVALPRRDVMCSIERHRGCRCTSSRLWGRWQRISLLS